MDDADLIRGVLAGYPGAEARFVGQFLPCIAAVVRNKGVPKSDREDLVQEVLLRLWEDDKRRLRRWQERGSGSLAAYLYVVTERLIIDCCWRHHPVPGGRSEVRQKAVGWAFDEATDPAQDVVAACLTRQQAAAILTTIGELPTRDAALIRRRHIAGQSYREIAAAMGMTVNHVGVALARAESRLRDHVRERHVDLFQAVPARVSARRKQRREGGPHPKDAISLDAIASVG
jgi:RNA polymerase sigma factor (sigma-70 family)